MLTANLRANAAEDSRGEKGRVMFFLLRVTFWLGLVLVLLPSGGSQPTPKMQVSAGEAVSAAKAAVGDIQHFCDRQKDACAIGSQAAVSIGHRAQAGAKILYEFLSEQFGPGTTGSVATPLPPARPSQHTLKPGDLAPDWRGPQPQREASRERRA